MNPDMMGKLKFNEEKRMYQEMTSNLNREVERMTISDDLKTINEQISFGTHIILTMAVMYFAGYFVMLKANFDMVTVRNFIDIIEIIFLTFSLRLLLVV